MTNYLNVIPVVFFCKFRACCASVIVSTSTTRSFGILSVISVKIDFFGANPVFILRLADLGLENFLLGLLVFS